MNLSQALLGTPKTAASTKKEKEKKELRAKSLTGLGGLAGIGAGALHGLLSGSGGFGQAVEHALIGGIAGAVSGRVMAKGEEHYKDFKKTASSVTFDSVDGVVGALENAKNTGNFRGLTSGQLADSLENTRRTGGFTKMASEIGWVKIPS